MPWQNGSGEAGGDCVAWHKKELKNLIVIDGVVGMEGESG